MTWHGDWHGDRHRRHARDAAGRARGRGGASTPPATPEDEARRRARRRAAAQAGLFAHFMSWVGVISLLFVINMLTTPSRPWFLFPAAGWGIGLLWHAMAVYGTRFVRERFFEPAMERELRRERATFQTEKQATIEQLSSTLAHEIRNPIAAARSLVQQMGEDPTSVENVQYASVALEELERVEQRVAHLLRYAREEEYRFELVNLAAVVDSALTQMRAKLDGARVAVARNYIGGPTVQADADKLRSVFANVIDNAIDAMRAVPEGRRLDLFVENGDGAATVRLRDNGAGMPPEHLERIFNPFFTTKEKGTGLGMAIARKVVDAHQGSITASSTPGRGTEFRVTLPLPARS